jgi:hypothetical protein
MYECVSKADLERQVSELELDQRGTFNRIILIKSNNKKDNSQI